MILLLVRGLAGMICHFSARYWPHAFAEKRVFFTIKGSKEDFRNIANAALSTPYK